MGKSYSGLRLETAAVPPAETATPVAATQQLAGTLPDDVVTAPDAPAIDNIALPVAGKRSNLGRAANVTLNAISEIVPPVGTLRDAGSQIIDGDIGGALGTLVPVRGLVGDLGDLARDAKGAARAIGTDNDSATSHGVLAVSDGAKATDVVSDVAGTVQLVTDKTPLLSMAEGAGSTVLLPVIGAASNKDGFCADAAAREAAPNSGPVSKTPVSDWIGDRLADHICPAAEMAAAHPALPQIPPGAMAGILPPLASSQPVASKAPAVPAKAAAETKIASKKPVMRGFSL